MINIEYDVDGTVYLVNSHGYRAPEFSTVDWGNSYIVQGCSQVFGESTIDYKQTMCFYLSELLQAPVINLGVPGSGMDIQFINAVDMLEQGIKPKGVFIVYPNMDRYTLYRNGKPKHIGPWSDERIDWMFDGNSRTHNINLVRGYRLLWNLSSISLYEWTHHPENKDFCNNHILWDSFLDFAPDNQHWGPKSSKEIAKILFNLTT